MKPFILFAILNLTLSPATILADELTAAEKDTLTYCEEQSTLAGIEETSEKAEYIRDCALNYGVVIPDASTAD